LVGQSWQDLDDCKKKTYQDKAANDKLRYAQELASFEKNGFFINKKGENSKDLFQPVIGEDVVQPKRPMSAYIFFSNSIQKSLREKNPSLGITEISKLVGQKWNKLSEKQKSPFYTQAEQDILRQQNEMNELISKGFFVNQEGTKSTDLVNKKKRQAVTSKAQENSPVTASKRKAMTEPVEPQEAIDKKSPKRVKK